MCLYLNKMSAIGLPRHHQLSLSKDESDAFKISCKTASRVKNSVSVFAQLSSVAFSASLFSDLN